MNIRASLTMISWQLAKTYFCLLFGCRGIMKLICFYTGKRAPENISIFVVKCFTEMKVMKGVDNP